MQRDHARLHRSLAVLGPPRRFQLMLLLLSGVDRSVSQLARAVRLSQSCTTRHLQALERAGLVKGLRDGKRVVFRPAPRDEAARGVVASLLHGEDLSGEAALLTAGMAAGAIPIASTAELDPITEPGREEKPERPGPRARRARARRTTPEPEPALDPSPPPDEPAAPRADPESGNTSEPYERPQWRSSDIEDFLL